MKDLRIGVLACLFGGLAIVGVVFALRQGGGETTQVRPDTISTSESIAVLPPTQLPIALLKARVKVAVAAGIWTYTIFNDEPLSSQQFVAAFSLDVVAPVTVTGVPPGWEVETDNVSYVLWTASDLQLPYPHHIAPGGSLGGFQIQSPRKDSESTAYIVTAWNHQTDNAGLVSPGLILSPAMTR